MVLSWVTLKGRPHAILYLPHGWDPLISPSHRLLIPRWGRELGDCCGFLPACNTHISANFIDLCSRWLSKPTIIISYGSLIKHHILIVDLIILIRKQQQQIHSSTFIIGITDLGKREVKLGYFKVSSAHIKGKPIKVWNGSVKWKVWNGKMQSVKWDRGELYHEQNKMGPIKFLYIKLHSLKKYKLKSNRKETCLDRSIYNWGSAQPSYGKWVCCSCWEAMGAFRDSRHITVTCFV